MSPTLKATSRRTSQILLGVVLFIVLFVTLMPFDFLFVSIGEVIGRFRLGLWPIESPDDFVLNIFLFIPIGFSWAGSLHRQRNGWLLFTGLLLGAVLSLGIESLQLFSYQRTSTIDDIVANMLGAGLGSLFYVWWGPIIWSALGRVLARIRPFLRPRRLIWSYVVYLLLLLLLTGYAYHLIQLDNWNPSYNLLLGNENRRGRRWGGQMRQTALWDAVLTPIQVQSLFNGQSASELASDHLLFAYDFTGPWANYRPFPQSPELMPTVPPEQLLDGTNGAQIGARQWLEGGPVPGINQRIAASSAFTLNAVVAATEFDRGGPGRIVTLSQDPFERNLTLGQTRPDLVLRLRNQATDKNGRFPEFTIPNFFTDTRFHSIVITYNGISLHLYDGQDAVWQQSLFPGLILISQWPLRDDVEALRLNGSSGVVFQWLWATAVWAPLGYVLAVWLRTRPGRRRWLLTLLTIAILVSAWEGLLVMLFPPYAWQWPNVYLSGFMAALVLLLLC